MIAQQFRKKPVEIEAVQLSVGNRHHIAAWIESGGGSATIPFVSPGIHIQTLEGETNPMTT